MSPLKEERGEMTLIFYCFQFVWLIDNYNWFCFDYYQECTGSVGLSNATGCDCNPWGERSYRACTCIAPFDWLNALVGSTWIYGLYFLIFVSKMSLRGVCAFLSFHELDSEMQNFLDLKPTVDLTWNVFSFFFAAWSNGLWSCPSVGSVLCLQQEWGVGSQLSLRSHAWVWGLIEVTLFLFSPFFFFFSFPCWVHILLWLNSVLYQLYALWSLENTCQDVHVASLSLDANIFSIYFS